MKKIFYFAGIALAAGLTMSSCEKNNEQGDTPLAPKADILSISATVKNEAEEDVVIQGQICRDSIVFVTEDALVGKEATFSFSLSENTSLYINDLIAVSGSFKTPLVSKIKFLAKAQDDSSQKCYYSSILPSFDPSAKLVSACFTKEFNPEVLASDCNADISGSNVVVSLPAGVKGKKLFLSLQSNVESTISIDGSAVVDGLKEVDTSFPCTILVTNTYTGTSASYQLAYATSAYTWKKVGEFTNENIDSFFSMTMDETTGEPYFAFQEKDVNSVSKASVIKFTDGSFERVGEPTFTATKATNICIASNNGTVYVFYAESSSKSGSVMKFNGASWSVVGDGIGEKTAGTSYYPTSLCLDQNGNPVIALTSNNNANSRREPLVRMFNGNSWSDFLKMPDRPNVGTDPMYGYTPRLLKAPDGVRLLVANQNANTFSLYKYVSSWTSEIASFGIDGATSCGTNNLDIEYNGKDLYAAINDNTGHNWQCSIHKLANGKAEQVGNNLPLVQDNKYDQFDLTSDEEGNLIVATISNKGTIAKVFTVDPDTKAWVGTDLGECDYSYLGAGRGKNGKVYVSFFTKNDGKYTINLYEGTKSSK